MQCPICLDLVVELEINRHLDSNCSIGSHSRADSLPTASSSLKNSSSTKKTDNSKSIAPIFSQKKRPAEPSFQISDTPHGVHGDLTPTQLSNARPPKRQKTSVANPSATPLAERLRPKEFSEFVGQDHLTRPDSLLVHLLQGSNGSAGSMILWGPSGCGKTTLARLLARQTDATLKEVSATSSGTNEVRNMMEEAKGLLSLTGR